MESVYRKWPESWIEAAIEAGFLRKVVVGGEVATYVADDVTLMSKLAVFAHRIVEREVTKVNDSWHAYNSWQADEREELEQTIAALQKVSRYTISGM